MEEPLVLISEGGLADVCTAVLVDTDRGGKAVFVKYEPALRNWWGRIDDAVIPEDAAK